MKFDNINQLIVQTNIEKKNFHKRKWFLRLFNDKTALLPDICRR